MESPSNPTVKSRDKRRTVLPLLGFGLLAVAVPQSVPAAQGSCELDRAHERAVVEHIYDGDTIRLRDGRKVRLVGINTPELGHDGKPDQPLAKRARKRLAQLAKPHHAVQLRYDEQQRDGYGRTLAHLFLSDGTNVQHEMLASGLATVIAIPPNLWQLECHLRSEGSAQTAHRGLWSLPRYRPVDAGDLTMDERGYRLITGRVQRVGKGRKTVWLRLAKRVAVQIPHSHTHYFTQDPPRKLTGQRILARGWLTPRRYGLSITIRHPSALRVLD